MEFRELEYIMEVAKERNISKAAENLYISQPALSRFIQRTEERWGVQLFENINKKLILTYAGEQYLKMARDILERKAEFEDRIEDIRELKTGSLSLGTTAGRGRNILKYILPEFCRKYPQYEIQVYQRNASQLEKMLQEGTIQLALFTIEEERLENYKSFALDLISREEVVLLAAKRRGIEGIGKYGFRYPWVNLREFEQQRFLLLEPESRLRQTADKIFAAYGMSLPHRLEFTSIDTICELVSQDFGVALVTDFHWQEDYGEDCQVFSVGKHPAMWQFVAAHRIGGYISEAAQDLVQITKRYFGNI